MKQKIIYTGKTKTGKDIIIRYPVIEDAFLMTKFINEISKEKTFVSFQGETILLEDETKWLNNLIEKIQEYKAVQLVVESEGIIIGTTGIEMQLRIEQHIGVFGIMIGPGFRNDGIGHLLMQLVIEEATKEIPHLTILTLQVFGDNPIAKAIYEKFGFKEYGRLPESISHQGKLVDHIYMYKKVLKN